MTNTMALNAVRGDAPFLDGKLGLNLCNVSALILEKSEIMRMTMSGVLHSLGIHDQRSTDDPNNAFNMLAIRPADIIFSDWCPGLDGISFLNMVRSNPKAISSYTPVIMVSANTDPRHIFVARDNGMTEYVAKPYTAKRIYDRVWEVVQRQRTFIKNSSFFGPDRRRRCVEPDGEERRVTEH